MSSGHYSLQDSHFFRNSSSSEWVLVQGMTATWVTLIACSRIISNQQYIPCSLYQTCLVRDTVRHCNTVHQPLQQPLHHCNSPPSIHISHARSVCHCNGPFTFIATPHPPSLQCNASLSTVATLLTPTCHTLQLSAIAMQWPAHLPLQHFLATTYPLLQHNAMHPLHTFHCNTESMSPPVTWPTCPPLQHFSYPPCNIHLVATLLAPTTCPFMVIHWLVHLYLLVYTLNILQHLLQHLTLIKCNHYIVVGTSVRHTSTYLKSLCKLVVWWWTGGQRCKGDRGG